MLGAGHVRDDDVRVQLRVAGPRQPVPVRRRHEPIAAHSQCAVPTTPRVARFPPDVRERCLEGSLVRLEQRRRHVLVADREQHAH